MSTLEQSLGSLHTLPTPSLDPISGLWLTCWQPLLPIILRLHSCWQFIFWLLSLLLLLLISSSLLIFHNWLIYLWSTAVSWSLWTSRSLWTSTSWSLKLPAKLLFMASQWLLINQRLMINQRIMAKGQRLMANDHAMTLTYKAPTPSCGQGCTRTDPIFWSTSVLESLNIKLIFWWTLVFPNIKLIISHSQWERGGQPW